MELKDKIIKELALQQVRFECRFPRGEVYNGFAVNDDYSPALRYADLEYELGQTKSTLRGEVIGLRNEGLVELVHTIDSVEEKPCASGWFLTDKGMRYAVDSNLIDKDEV